MQRIAAPPLDARLQRRFVLLVMNHMQACQKLAAGVKSLLSASTAFAATQAAWRFLNNERVTLSKLEQPLREVARERAAVCHAPFLLLVHDWSKFTFEYAKSKRDLVQLTHQDDVGYELTTALLVSADDGQPIAPMEMHLKTADGVLSTREGPVDDAPHVDQVLPTMHAVRDWALPKPVLHIIDREADSVDHYRQWDAGGYKFLVRADDRRVLWNDEPKLLSEIVAHFKNRREFRCVGTASYQGKNAQLWVAETKVVLHRPAKKSHRGKKYEKSGLPLELRFVVVQVRNPAGKVLATWMLLTNVFMVAVTAELLAQCYYWRWRIESFFKLLKSHGQQVESWQQQTGPAIARRLLIAAMACVMVWQLQAEQSPQAQQLKDLLVRLSGRQTKRNRPHTAPALLAGLWVLLSALSMLEHYDLSELKTLAKQIQFFDTG